MADENIATLVKQGAEARVYKIPFLPGRPAIVKERFKKSYRHPVLDEKLTARRVVQEARSLQRLRRAGIDTPILYLLDIKRSTIYMEFIDGISVRDFISERRMSDGSIDNELASAIGKCLAIMHGLDIIHGDLTTSNMMLRAGTSSLVLIDFGLSMVSTMVEDKAVDLYVLERALSSTHPNTEALFQAILDAYRTNGKGAQAVLKKLEEVRRRGRKRTAFG
ncbi:kinase-like domain-containing protein [Fimicolochytrium jonesii]|uniref:kinase-like domain-containing protein n=1 Tax=Fimicolochytrium jonesii TaxID=1396493 RepID=UPI0022FF06A1|nr:kinase-like domain-containing protein [Fimicolochytrium jonesii]KAI8820768.1 kinase-like domain-containing protein [Fimicolochytrium jonesii]